MRQFAAAIVLAAFASLTAFDALCCPDGCTARSSGQALELQHDSDTGDCLQCLGGLSAPVSLVFDRATLVVTPLCQLSPLAPDAGAIRPLDQPPRA